MKVGPQIMENIAIVVATAIVDEVELHIGKQPLEPFSKCASSSNDANRAEHCVTDRETFNVVSYIRF